MSFQRKLESRRAGPGCWANPGFHRFTPDQNTAFIRHPGAQKGYFFQFPAIKYLTYCKRLPSLKNNNNHFQTANNRQKDLITTGKDRHQPGKAVSAETRVARLFERSGSNRPRNWPRGDGDSHRIRPGQPCRLYGRVVLVESTKVNVVQQLCALRPGRHIPAPAKLGPAPRPDPAASLCNSFFHPATAVRGSLRARVTA